MGAPELVQAFQVEQGLPPLLRILLRDCLPQMGIEGSRFSKDLGSGDLPFLLVWCIGDLLDRSEGVDSHA